MSMTVIDLDSCHVISKNGTGNAGNNSLSPAMRDFKYLRYLELMQIHFSARSVSIWIWLIDHSEAALWNESANVQLSVSFIVQERRNSNALAMQLHLSCTNSSICDRLIDGPGFIDWMPNQLRRNTPGIYADKGPPQAITWTNAGLLATGPLGTNLCGYFSSRKCIPRCNLQNGIMSPLPDT